MFHVSAVYTSKFNPPKLQKDIVCDVWSVNGCIPSICVISFTIRWVVVAVSAITGTPCLSTAQTFLNSL